jgi:hypothetical protein
MRNGKQIAFSTLFDTMELFLSDSPSGETIEQCFKRWLKWSEPLLVGIRRHTPRVSVEYLEARFRQACGDI